MVIRIIDRHQASCALKPLRLKLDPGSKTTGIALVRDADTLVEVYSGGSKRRTTVLLLMELAHRGQQISSALAARRQMRRRRRGNLRYRAPRFLNRGNKRRGWLPPSLQHRVNTTLAWVKRFRLWAPVSAISCEVVRFDTHALQNPEVSGIEYSQGTLFGYEVREYLLEKWGRQCAYCDATGVPLQIEHIRSKARGGSDRVSNLTLACEICNQKKSARSIEELLAHDPVRLARLLSTAQKPLRDAAAVNSTRCALIGALKTQGLPLETASGGRTKFNRRTLGIPKTHALDAACVGQMDTLQGWRKGVLNVKAMGRGSYQRTRLTQYGFPRGFLLRAKRVHGFATGDLVKAQVPSGRKAGRYTGRVAIRASGSFNIQTRNGVTQGISYKQCRLLQRSDGYGYQFTTGGAAAEVVRYASAKRTDATRPPLYLCGLKAEVSREELG
jgi:5-methylcytosine-specific restriction endonuclease McrA